MMQPGLPNRVAGLLVTPDVTVAAMHCGNHLRHAADARVPSHCATPSSQHRHRTFALQTAISLMFVLAVGKAVADPFKPFLYFRF